MFFLSFFCIFIRIEFNMGELPFQWDDGVFISPFVASSNETAAAVARWVHERYLYSSSPKALRLIDLGCGDGAALFGTAEALNSLGVSVQATGIELDEGLVAKAEAEAATRGGPGRSFRFLCADIQTLNLDLYFPLPPAGSAETEPPTVLFLYLLPEALAVLEDSLTRILKERRTVIISNRWSIPYFSSYQKTTEEESVRDLFYVYAFP